MELLANVNMQGLRHYAELSALLGCAWQALKIVALYYGIRLIMAVSSYITTAEKKLDTAQPSAGQADEVIKILRSVEDYLEHGASRKHID